MKTIPMYLEEYLSTGSDKRTAKEFIRDLKMNTYKIEVTTTDYPEIYGKYMAVFEGYDGGMIDNETPSDDKIGYGDTEMEAMFNLLEQSL